MAKTCFLETEIDYILKLLAKDDIERNETSLEFFFEKQKELGKDNLWKAFSSINGIDDVQAKLLAEGFNKFFYKKITFAAVKNYIDWLNKNKKVLVNQNILDKLMNTISQYRNDEIYYNQFVNEAFETSLSTEEYIEIFHIVNAIKSLFSVFQTTNQTVYLEQYYSKVFDLQKKVKEIQKKQEQLIKGDNKEAMSLWKQPLDLVSKLFNFKTIYNVFALQKTLRASMDISYTFMQMSQVLFYNPALWYQNIKKGMQQAWSSSSIISEKDLMEIERKNFIVNSNRTNDINGVYALAKLDIESIAYKPFLQEEDLIGYETLEKLIDLSKKSKITKYSITPILNLIKMSGLMMDYTIKNTRKDLFDILYSQRISDNGGYISNDETIAIGELTNTLTGRGRLPIIKDKTQNAVGILFFSLKKLASNYQLLTAGSTNDRFTVKEKKIMRLQLFKTVISYGAVLWIVSALNGGDDDEWYDPRSSNFGSMKIGDKRVNVTNGNSGLMVFAFRLFLQVYNLAVPKEKRVDNYRSATTKQTYQLGEKVSVLTGTDVVVNFIANKLNPTLGTFWNLLNGEGFSQGELNSTKKWLSLLTEQVIPISVEDIVNSIILDNDKDESILISTVFNMVGLNVSDYKYSMELSESNNKYVLRLAETLSYADFEKFNKEYNQVIQDYINTEEYKKIPNDKKQSELTKYKNRQIKLFFNRYSTN